MHICTYNAQVEASRTALWQLLTNVKHWTTWDPGLQSVELEGAFRQGAKGTLIYKDGSKRTFNIIKLQVLESLVISMTYLNGSELRLRYDLKAVDAVVDMEHEVSLTASPFAMLLLRGQKDLLTQNAGQQLEKILGLLKGEHSPFKEGSATRDPRKAF